METIENLSKKKAVIKQLRENGLTENQIKTLVLARSKYSKEGKIADFVSSFARGFLGGEVYKEIKHINLNIL
jgi:hypothetical protein